MKGGRDDEIDDDDKKGDEGSIGGDGRFEGSGRASPAADSTSSGGHA